MPKPNINGLILRAMQATDLPQVLAIEAASYFTPWPQALFLDALNSPQQECLVLAQADEVLAYIIVATIIDEADLLNVAVAQPWRQQGLARYLIETQQQQLQARGVARFFLEVNVENHAAQHLYKQLGFQLMGRRKGYYPSATGPQDALVMCYEFQS